ncbi:DEAD/DEAH box helicase [Candidatus Woesearchaeota archaeon]|nr:DEAD/DEAH box helicase [Candidatus Woesearchaeota archaeon]
MDKVKDKIPQKLYDAITTAGVSELRPAQVKSLASGLLESRNLLVCTPTASGKTLIAELAAVSSILNKKGKAVYVVPLKALASEKYNDFKKRYGSFIRVALSVGDFDASDHYLSDYDLIICTAEKLDSLIRHHAPWVRMIAVVIIDEIHLLNDAGRGPTLEILITILRKLLPKAQFIGLSATIGNPEELAKWLDAGLVVDSWRPVKLHQGVYRNGVISFKK